MNIKNLKYKLGLILGIISIPFLSFGATILFPFGGGTGISTAPSYGQLLMGNGSGVYTLVATSSLGIIGGGGSGLSSLTSPNSTIDIGGSLSDPTLDIDFMNVPISSFTNDSGYINSISGLNISELTNDSGFLSSIVGLNISDLTNDSGYITSVSGGDHGLLTGLTDDDHTQYALLVGRSGGQTLIGGTASGNNLTLRSTSNATKGKIVFGSAGTSVFDEVNSRWGLGTATPGSNLSVIASGNGVSIGATVSSAGFALNREVNTGAIINASNSAYQFTQQGNGFETQEYNSGGSFVGRTIFNNGKFGVVGTDSTTSSLNNFWVKGNTALGTNYKTATAPTDGLLVEGNVGIGTTTPGQKLSVAGDILGNNIIGSYFTSTSTTASSTFANGINLTSGCFAIGGNCITTGGGGGATALEDLTDVGSMSKTYGDLLYWNGSVWSNIATSSLGITGLGGSVAWGGITGTLSNQTDLQSALDAKITANTPITGATKTKITYDTNGLVTSGADATTADIADSSNKRYVTDAQLTVIGNTSGTNTGDQSSIAGITGTKSQFDTAVTDGNFLYVGDVTQYTAENAQDDVGGMVANSSTVNLTYSDATPSLTASVVNDSIGATQLDSNQSLGTITFEVDGQGSAITTGAKKAYLAVAYNCTIVSWDIVADQTGSAVIDIWKDTYANFAPTVADTITASAKPTLSSAQKAQSSSLTGWTTSLSAGDYLEFNIDSASTVTKLKLTLKVTRD